MRLNRKPLLKSALLLVALSIIGGMALAGCAPQTNIPRGWSGGVISGNTLFVGSMSGDIVSFDATTGARLWVLPLETSKPSSGGFGCAAPGPAAAIYGSPALGNNLVYVGGYVKRGNDSFGKIYAFSAGKNEPRWLYPREGFLEGPIVGGLVASGDRLYFGTAEGKVYALDAADGFKQAEFQTGDKIWSTPAVDGDTVYIGSFDKKLYALDASTLQPKKWGKFEAGGAILSTPVIYKGLVYISSLDRNLYAVSATDGSEKAKFLAGAWFWAKPLAYNDTIYAPGLNEKVYILDAVTLQEKTKPIGLSSPIYSSPVLVGDKVVIATEQGEVYSLDTTSNTVKKIAALDEKVYAPLAESQGSVYAHTEKDNVYAVEVQTGALRKFQIK